ncbi:MAG: hypothetical protein GEU95_18670 [Rhizobiales bacterium]|nr:hypothetical protein [Hyphomicrobiales bacterium]
MGDRSTDHRAAVSSQDRNRDRDQAVSQPDDGFSVGIEDVVIVPLVAVAFAIWRALRRSFFILIDIVDFTFPILLQLMRFPLFTLRILGDGIAAMLNGIVRFLPVGGARRGAWREFVSRQWAWLRQKISYKAFEEAVHHAFEKGMAWVFKACRTLTPRTALLVLFGAVLWLPISFGVATLMHAALIAKATSLPAWMQLLHPVATVIAKSKLLVLPVYPAAWPQAKRHPLVQAMIRFWNYLMAHYLARKTAYRYRQTEVAAAQAGDALRHTAASAGLIRLGSAMLAGLNTAVAGMGGAMRAVSARAVDVLSMVPLFGGIVERYEAHYDEANLVPADKFSHRVRGFFERWSVKFTAEYYETKERQDAAKGHVGA